MADAYDGKSPRFFKTAAGQRVTWTFTPSVVVAGRRNSGIVECSGCGIIVGSVSVDGANKHAGLCREVPE